MKKQTAVGIVLRLLVLAGTLIVPLLGAVVFGALGHLSAIAIPVVGAISILSALGYVPVPLSQLFLVLLCCAAFRGALAYGEQRQNHDVAFRLLARIRDQIFTALRRLCPAKLEGRDRGDLITLITSDIELLEVFYAHTISPVAIAALVSTSIVVVLTFFHPAYALTAFVGYLMVGVLLPLCMAPRAQRLHTQQRKAFGDLSSYTMGSLRGLIEILQFSGEEERLAGIRQRTQHLGNLLVMIGRQDGRVNAWADVLVLGFGGIMLMESAFIAVPGDFAAILIPTVLMLSSFGPVLALSRLSGGLSRTLAAGERVLSLLDEEPEVLQNMMGAQPDFTGASIENPQFSYQEQTVLDDIKLTIIKNQITGLCGESGSGKSTLLRLLMRFWDARQGSVCLSGADVRDIQTAHLRMLEGFMTQDTDLFQMSIGENIAIGKMDATAQEIRMAAEKASLHTFITGLPRGYDTPVGELGDTLSGGERQRIGLARAFLHDAPLLLLDEPTSNLDSLNEAVILRALRTERGKRTIVLTSHRRSTLSVCDTVIHLGDEVGGQSVS